MDGEHHVADGVAGAGSEEGGGLVGQAEAVEGEDVGQEIADDEDGDGEAEDGEDHDDAVDPGAVFPGGEHAHGNGDADGEDQGQDHERDGGFEALTDHGGDRQIGEDRGAEIAVEDVPEPFAEADEEGAVEAEADADAFDVGRAGLVAGDDGGRVAGGDVEKAEDEECDDPHDGDRRDDATGDVVEHQVFVTSQKTGNGALTMPVRFFRQD